MTKRINAIKSFMPQIELNKTVQIDELANYISRGTNLSPGEIKYVIDELAAALLFFASSGQPVKLDSLGTFTPVIRLNGDFTLNVRVDRELVRGLNAPGAFTGRLRNSANIGLSSDDLVEQWNRSNASDPVLD